LAARPASAASPVRLSPNGWERGRGRSPSSAILVAAGPFGAASQRAFGASRTTSAQPVARRRRLRALVLHPPCHGHPRWPQGRTPPAAPRLGRC